MSSVLFFLFKGVLLVLCLVHRRTIYTEAKAISRRCFWGENGRPLRLCADELIKAGRHFPPKSNADSLPWLLFPSFFYGLV